MAQLDTLKKTNQKTNTVTLIDNATGKEYTFPVLEGSTGPRVIDTRRLFSETGMFTYDPGYTSTGSCDSKITFIDGDKGILLHRGYRIEDLAEHCDFLEVCHLLLYGNLPTEKEYNNFSYTIAHHTMVHEKLRSFFNGFRSDAHPMAILCGATVSACASAGSITASTTAARTSRSRS